MLKEYLELFSETEIFIFVFIEIITRLEITQRILNHKATTRDKVVITLLFGGFSILGTYIGTKLSNGSILNVRDFGPIIAGLIGGPWVGLGAGVIGGVHRFFMGGPSNISCGLSTMLAGLICGLVYLRVRGRLLKFHEGALLAVIVEFLHGLLTLAIVRPFDVALDIVMTAIPAMMIANGIGAMIALLLLSSHAGGKTVKLEPGEMLDASAGDITTADERH